MGRWYAYAQSPSPRPLSPDYRGEGGGDARAGRVEIRGARGDDRLREEPLSTGTPGERGRGEGAWLRLTSTYPASERIPNRLLYLSGLS